MPDHQDFLLGEFHRTLDDRHRLSLPLELAGPLTAHSPECILAKERPGCLSLWSAPLWQAKLDQGVALIRQKMQAGKLEGRVGLVQRLGRLLSTRHKTIQMAARGRLLIPQGFREFLAVEPGDEVLVIGAAVCIEIWKSPAWVDYLAGRMPRFRRLFDHLAQ